MKRFLKILKIFDFFLLKDFRRKIFIFSRISKFLRKKYHCFSVQWYFSFQRFHRTYVQWLKNFTVFLFSGIFSSGFLRSRFQGFLRVSFCVSRVFHGVSSFPYDRQKEAAHEM